MTERKLLRLVLYAVTTLWATVLTIGIINLLEGK